MDRVDRILIYRLGSLGDTVVALPCFKLIRRTFSSAHIAILTNQPIEARAAPLAAVLGNSGLFDEVLDYPIELRQADEILRLRNRIRSGKFDLVIHLSQPRGFLSSLRDWLFFRWCGVRRILGVPFRHEDLHVLPHKDGLFENESRRLLRRIRQLGGIDLSDRASWDLGLTADEKREAAQILASFGIGERFIAISLGTKFLVNDWTGDRWKQMLTEVSKLYPELPVVAVGAESERDLVDDCLASWRGQAANLCGKTSPRVSCAVLARALLFIGHDSGPMHLASAVGAPCVALFSGLNPPGQWYPFGRNHIVIQAKTICDVCPTQPCRKCNGRCILSLAPRQVIEAVQQKLDQLLFVPAG